MIYKQNKLFIDKISVEKLAKKFNTPLYCYSHQKLNENNYDAISNVGAYGFELSSNYNTRPLIAEIFVNKNKHKKIRKRQNLLELIKL